MSGKLAAALGAAFFVSVTAGAAQGELPHLAAIGAAGKRASVETIRTEAHVTVSDGLEYDVVTLFHDRQRAIFHRSYGDRTVTLGVEGRYFWSFDGTTETEGPALYESIVLGHQVHAQILFFDRINGPIEQTAAVDCGSARCLSYGGSSGHAMRVNDQTHVPVELVLKRDDAADVIVAFDRWLDVDGVSLPFLFTIDDGERVFEFEHQVVVFNEGSMDELRAPMERLSDEQKLLRLHRIAMNAHLFGEAGMMRGLFAEEGVVVSDGEIFPGDESGMESLMERLLSNRDYTRYDDLVRPIVRVSDDGSLGWVVAQVEAEGVRLDPGGSPTGPLEFTSAWISTFAKVDGAWKQTGNVSTFMPGRK